MKTTKAKGFTLIELIVVIAIIGVLAAILVPTMLGYVTKSRCSSANANAKSLYNALNSALVDLDSEGEDVSGTDYTSRNIAAPTATFTPTKLKDKVARYFADYAKLSQFGYTLENGTCVAVVIKNGAYFGSYPNPSTIDNCKNAGTVTLAYAKQTNAGNQGGNQGGNQPQNP